MTKTTHTLKAKRLALLLLVTMLPQTSLLAEPLKVGDTIPDVAVRTEDNAEVKLRDLAKSKPTVLIFYRGGWCPFCNRHLSALVEIQDDLKAAGAQMLAISMDQPSKIKDTPKHDELGYQLLSDADAAAAEAFGIVFTVPDTLVTRYKNEYGIDLEAASGRTHHKLPHPSVFVADSSGVIRFAHVNEDYKVRLKPDKILNAAQEARP